ncbi:MAG: OmpA family protein [Phaeodactylibacter sp.]|nr:OmpA family protein [Phaeodactylibacter sp.]
MSSITGSGGSLRRVIFSGLLLLPLCLPAQQHQLEQAARRIEQLDYTRAIQLLEEVVATYGPVGRAPFQLATCYRMTHQLASAKYWYAQAVRLPDAGLEDWLFYAEVLQQSGDCGQSLYWLNKYLEQAPGDEQALNLKKACTVADQLLEKGQGRYQLTVLPFNTAGDEFGATFWEEGLVFSSERSNPSEPRMINAATGRPFFQLYQLAGDWTVDDTPTALPENVRSFLNDSAPVYCAATRELYFTRNNTLNGQQQKGSNGLVQLGLYRTFYEGNGHWSTPEPLSLNSLEFSCMHPALSADGRTLYFASDMPGGWGGLDLYRSERLPNDSWGPPVNMGRPLNTAGTEAFPFLQADQSFYFASDGHVGLGGLDLFRLDLDAKGTAEPENLGAPVNSRQDDFAYQYDPRSKRAVMASNRPGGIGGDDLYLLEKIAATYQLVLEAADTHQPITTGLLISDCQADTIAIADSAQLRLELPLHTCCSWRLEVPGYQPLQKTICTHQLPPGFETTLQLGLEPLRPLFLEGVVFDQSTGLPLKNAIVQIESNCGAAITPVTTQQTGYYSFELNRGCCYKVKAQLNNYLAATADNICLGTEYIESSHRVNLYLQPTIYDGANLFQAEVEEKQAVYRDAVTGLWMDQLTNQPADGTYPDGWEYDSGLIIRQGALVDRRSNGFLKGRSRAAYNEPIPFLLNIYFDFNSTEIQESARPELRKLLQLLKDNPAIRIEIGAHTDARGGTGYNKRLSQKRADGIADWLVAHGIAGNRVQAVGYGESQLVNDCREDSDCSEAQHQLNRRTEFRVLQ